MPRGLTTWGAHALHLRCFLYGLRPAIKNVTRLEIKSSSTESSAVESVATLLAPLALACPALQDLKLAGDFGKAFWADQLPPNLTHARFPSLPLVSFFPEHAPASCMSLLSCPNLTNLDVDLHALSPEMWRALPRSLTELRCCLAGGPPSNTKQLPNLLHLILCCHMFTQVDLCDAVAVLRTAPQLRSLEMSATASADNRQSSSCMTPHLHVRRHWPRDRCVPDLLFLNERVLAGLVVSSTFSEGGGFDGVMLSLPNDCVGNPEDGTAGFVASLPPLLAVQGLMLEEFEEADLSAIVPAIGVTFPSLRSLVIDMLQPNGEDEVLVDLGMHDLTPLAACPTLMHLSLEWAQVSPHQLLTLCLCLKSLEGLRLFYCSQSSTSDGEDLQRELEAQGSCVEVTIDSDKTTEKV